MYCTVECYWNNGMTKTTPYPLRFRRPFRSLKEGYEYLKVLIEDDILNWKYERFVYRITLARPRYVPSLKDQNLPINLQDGGYRLQFYDTLEGEKLKKLDNLAFWSSSFEKIFEKLRKMGPGPRYFSVYKAPPVEDSCCEYVKSFTEGLRSCENWSENGVFTVDRLKRLYKMYRSINESGSDEEK